jgi:2-keto-3-deoxy-L-rhamnonate aldolase RhmA
MDAPQESFRAELVEQHKAFGFRFVALGSDASAIATGMTQNLAAIRRQGMV